MATNETLISALPKANNIIGTDALLVETAENTMLITYDVLKAALEEYFTSRNDFASSASVVNDMILSTDGDLTDALLVDVENAYGKLNYSKYRVISSKTTSLPDGLGVGIREVKYYNKNNILVLITEIRPNPGRIWTNQYDVARNTWMGWKTLSNIINGDGKMYTGLTVLRYYSAQFLKAEIDFTGYNVVNFIASPQWASCVDKSTVISYQIEANKVVVWLRSESGTFVDGDTTTASYIAIYN